MIGSLPRGGTQLAFMGHADVTRALIESDPFWSWEPMALAEDGSPLIVKRGDMLELWGKLTIHGVTRIGVGTCPVKPESSKELVGDLFRNCAMRFGIGLSLRSKSEWHDDTPVAPTVPEGMSTIADAKIAVVEAFGGDKTAAADWWKANMARVPSTALFTADEMATLRADVAAVAPPVGPSDGAVESTEGVLFTFAQAKQAVVEEFSGDKEKAGAWWFLTMADMRPEETITAEEMADLRLMASEAAAADATDSPTATP